MKEKSKAIAAYDLGRLLFVILLSELRKDKEAKKDFNKLLHEIERTSGKLGISVNINPYLEAKNDKERHETLGRITQRAASDIGDSISERFADLFRLGNASSAYLAYYQKTSNRSGLKPIAIAIREFSTRLGIQESIVENYLKNPGDFSEEFASAACSLPPIFIVHGHDTELKEKLARFLEKLRLKAIILHEQPNKGRTIIKKLLDYSQEAGFAFVILTPDDQGFSRRNPKKIQNRARQNVILELGLFLGLLGPSRVCVLHKGNIELPSDIHGVLYIPIEDFEHAKLQIISELKAADIQVNMDRVV